MPFNFVLSIFHKFRMLVVALTSLNVFPSLLSALHAELENFNEMKVFICLSTVMTWARSKPLDPVSILRPAVNAVDLEMV